MTYEAIFQDGAGGFWREPFDGESSPVELFLCPACNAVVASQQWHTEWHEYIQEKK